MKSFKKSINPSFKLFGSLFDKEGTRIKNFSFHNFWNPIIQKFKQHTGNNIILNCEPTFVRFVNKYDKKKDDKNIQVNHGSGELSLPQITNNLFDAEFVVN